MERSGNIVVDDEIQRGAGEVSGQSGEGEVLDQYTTMKQRGLVAADQQGARGEMVWKGSASLFSVFDRCQQRVVHGLLFPAGERGSRNRGLALRERLPRMPFEKFKSRIRIRKEEEAVTRLSRVGFDGTIGYLKGGFDAWKQSGKDVDTIQSVSAEEAKKQINSEGTPVYDVRKPGEYQSEHVVDATNTPLDFINDYMGDFPEDKKFFVHCAGGYRSVIASSILKSRGIHNLIDIDGGFGALKNSGVKVSEYVCPSTL